MITYSFHMIWHCFIRFWVWDDFEWGHLYDFECRDWYGYECRTFMTTNVAVVWQWMSHLYDSECRRYDKGCRDSYDCECRRRQRMCGRKFRISGFSLITCFAGFPGTSGFLKCPLFFSNIMDLSSFRNSSAPPKFSHVPFFLDIMTLRNLRHSWPHSRFAQNSRT